jgi:hypothetical protein
MKRFIAKHHEGLSLLALCSLFIVADAEPHVMLAWLPVPIILVSLSAIGKRINKQSESEEL